MKKAAVLIFALISAFLLAACGKSSAVMYEHPQMEPPVAGKSWTVLIYMMGGAGETNNAAASEKLADIMSIDYPANIHVVTETGGSSEWHTKGIYSDYIQRFEAVGQNRLYLADQMKSASMGDYRTLTEFIMWGTARYKADNYMLIISGSGGGSMYGIGADELYDNDLLTLEEISYAMSVAGTKFELVGMDASLMGSLETAAAISNYTDYLAAPQDVQNSDAWNYREIMRYICGNNNAEGWEVGKVICDSYFESAKADGSEKNAAMSVIDASKITTLNQAFDGMAGDMLISTDSLDNYKSIADALSGVCVYGGGSADEGWSDLVDLGDMAVRCSEYTGMTADRLIEVLNDTVKYRVCGEEQAGATGLAVYFPLDKDAGKLQLYMDMSHGSKYKEFLRKICINCDVYDSVTNTSDYRSSWAWETYENDMAWLEYASVLDGNRYELDISGNMTLFNDVSLNVYKYDKKSGRYTDAGRYRDIKSDWESGIFEADFDCRLPLLGGRQVSMSLIRSYDGCRLYSVPALVNGEVSSIRVKEQDGNYKILGYWSTLDTNGIALGAMRQFKPSDRITPMLAVYNEHEERAYVLGKTFRKFWRGVDKDKTGDGNYILEFVMTDIYGLERYGTPVNAKISGKRVSFK